MKARVAVVTTARSDYAACYWLIHELLRSEHFEARLVVAGSHLSAAHGMTVREIEQDGWPIFARVPFSEEDGARAGTADGRRASRAVAGFTDLFATLRPDIAVVYGDRYELMSVGMAAVTTRTPLAHVCGGDVTEGAIDEQVRHSLTKLAHVHFPSAAGSAERILQMGEEPWRVHLVGDPALDAFARGTRASDDELAAALGWRPDGSTVLVAFHAVTLEEQDTARQAAELSAALRAHTGAVVITGPAPDPGAELVRRELQALAAARPRTVYVENLGGHLYRGLMRRVGALVGNSSSGLSEAPCVPLPAVNIGSRQDGRERAANVLDVPPERSAIASAIAKALSPGFRDALSGIRSPYGDGQAAPRVIAVLESLPERGRLLRKKFASTGACGGGRDAGSEPGELPPAIGGDFEIDADDLEPRHSDAVLFATARQALAAIARSRGAQPGLWLVPDFICPIVPEALRRGGADVLPYAWRTPWHVDREALERLVPRAVGIIVPFYQGLPPEGDLWEVLAGASLWVVEDRCQCVGAPPAAQALRGDYAVGSFRKWLAVPDGAYCVAREGNGPVPTGPPSAEMVGARLAAGLLRRVVRVRVPVVGGARSRGSLLERTSVELFQLGEDAADRAPRGSSASGLAKALIAAADIEGIRAARLRNQAWLAERLERNPALRILEPAPGAIARGATPLLTLPVACADRERTCERMAALRVFCAVHWKDGDWAGVGGRPAEWAASLLSLPIDQRYGLDDMQQLLRCLT